MICLSFDSINDLFFCLSGLVTPHSQWILCIFIFDHLLYENNHDEKTLKKRACSSHNYRAKHYTINDNVFEV